MAEGDGGDDGNAPGMLHGASVGRRVAIGCFTSWLGFVSGAMVAALLSRFTAFLMRADGCPDIPSCNWYIWAGIGGVIGASTLPVLVLSRLGRPARKPNSVGGL